jgi:carboxymethylenebutenolidase
MDFCSGSNNHQIRNDYALFWCENQEKALNVQSNEERRKPMIEFPVNEKTASGYLALPKGGTGPGVLVLHAWWGLNDFFKQVCERLAVAGFVAFAPDLYHGVVASTIDEAKQVQSTFHYQQHMEEVKGAAAFLRGQPAAQGSAIGAVGCSMGAAYALLLSTLLPDEVAAVVSFYGAYAEPDYSKARAAYLVHFAEHDEWEPDEDMEKLGPTLRAAGKEATVYRYPGTIHWFFEADRPDAYNPEAARVAWERTLAFFRQHLRARHKTR